MSGREVETVVTVSAQHRQLLDQALSFFQITPNYDFDIMRENQTRSDVVARIILSLEPVLIKEKPDIVLVQGDTSTCVGASLCAFYNRTPLGHIEAGLRSWNRFSPYPEEQNRRLVDSVSDFAFSPTEGAKENLVREGHDLRRIRVVGNTAIDVLSDLVAHPREIDEQTVKTFCRPNARIILVTAHRTENIGQPLLNLCRAIKSLLKRNPDDIQVIFPVHLNPKVLSIVKPQLDGVSGVSLLEPLPYNLFVPLLKRSYFVITDSGGVQEEAAYLGKPTLVMRDFTERTESVDAGTSIMVGTGTEKLEKSAIQLLKGGELYRSSSKPVNPYGPGRAAKRIVDFLIADSSKALTELQLRA